MLGGERRELRLGLRAFKAMGVNPFKATELNEFVDGMTVDRAAIFVRACLLHEYAKTGPKFGEVPPTEDEIIDMLDMAIFEGAMRGLIEAAGLLGGKDEGAPAAAADPQAAQSGRTSGP